LFQWGLASAALLLMIALAVMYVVAAHAVMPLLLFVLHVLARLESTADRQLEQQHWERGSI
jgi:type IV secretory pathway VirB3-like protein